MFIICDINDYFGKENIGKNETIHLYEYKQKSIFQAAEEAAGSGNRWTVIITKFLTILENKLKQQIL